MRQVAEVLLEEALPEDVFSVYWRVTMPALMRCFRSFLYIAGTKISNSCTKKNI
jgi:hypothetical protein